MNAEDREAIRALVRSEVRDAADLTFRRMDSSIGCNMSLTVCVLALLVLLYLTGGAR